jgi:hypothetical protein
VNKFRRDLEVHDVPPAAESPVLDGSLFVRATTAIRITTMERGEADLMPLVTFTGTRGSLTLHFDGGARAVERLRDRLTDYLEKVESAEAVASEDRRREADASEEGS